MAEFRNFDPESMKDAADALIHYVEETAREALTSEEIRNDFERQEIALAVIGVRPAVNALVRFIPRLNPETENGFMFLLCTLMADLLTIGSASMYTKDAQAHLFKMRAEIMQRGNSAKAQTKGKKIKAAILEVCKGMTLINSSKFAGSIQSEVCKKLGVKTDAKGYSARTFQRIISTILKECRES
jgi:hypothetical protein